MNEQLATPIVTPRLVIRLAQRHDLDALFALHNDIETTRYIPHMHWVTRAEAEPWFARALERRQSETGVQCVVVKRATVAADEVVIGTTVLFNIDAASGLAELGYLLGREHWGQGYGQEAVAAFIEFAFTALPLRRLEALVDTRNEASSQLVKRLGFTREGVLRERWLVAGELKDITLFALLKREWTGRSADAAQ
jgi:[ribosomal protein S5]-alanine N-acetyltransferase